MQEPQVQFLGQERSLGDGNGNPLQYACLEIPWTGEPGGLESMRLKRVRHDLVTKQDHMSIQEEQSQHSVDPTS